MAATGSGVQRTAICPWAFMGCLDSDLPSSPPVAKAKTFASIVSDPIESSVSLSQLPALIVRGDKTYIKINEALYQEQLKSFKTNLLGRLLLRKGSTPLKTADLKGMLNTLWRPSAPWRLVPLGKGYFDIHFATEEDLCRVWGGGTCTLSNGIFRLAQWKPDFVPGDVLPQTHAQLWGSRLLVDVDLARDLPSSLMIERETHCFPIEVVYENLCAHCGLVGHTVDRCKQLNGKDHRPSKQPEKVSKPSTTVVRQEYRVKRNVATTDVREDVQATQTSPPSVQPIAPPSEVIPEHGLIQRTPSRSDDILTFCEGNLGKVAQFAQTVIEQVATEEIERIAQRVSNEPFEETNTVDDDLSSFGSSERVPDDGFCLENETCDTAARKGSCHDLAEIDQCAVDNNGTPLRGQLELQAVNFMLEGDGETENMTLVLSKRQKKRLRKKQREGKQPDEGTVERYPVRNRGPPQKLNL
ncbi:hypothetical protein ACLB2K_057942 [Fragaria x ananassa]